MLNKFKVSFNPGQEEYSIKVTFENKEEMMKFLDDQQAKKENEKALNTKLEEMKNEAVESKKTIDYWHDEFEKYFYKYTKLQKKFKRLKTKFKTDLVNCGISMTDHFGTWHLEDKILLLLDKLLKDNDSTIS